MGKQTFLGLVVGIWDPAKLVQIYKDAGTKFLVIHTPVLFKQDIDALTVTCPPQVNGTTAVTFVID